MKDKTYKECLEAHNDAIALFGLKKCKPEETNQFGWCLSPDQVAMRDLGDRIIVSSVFKAQSTGDKPYQNIAVFVPVDSPPMVVQGDNEDWQHIFSVELW